MRVTVTRGFLVAMLAISTMAMSGAARADATQPAVARPETAQLRIDRCGFGDGDMVPVRAGSDDSLFGSSAADGVR